MKDAPCKNCQERFLSCHAVCQRYKDWKEDNDKTRKKQQKAKAAEWEIDSVHFDGREKALKRLHRH